MKMIRIYLLFVFALLIMGCAHHKPVYQAGKRPPVLKGGKYTLEDRSKHIVKPEGEMRGGDIIIEPRK